MFYVYDFINLFKSSGNKYFNINFNRKKNIAAGNQVLFRSCFHFHSLQFINLVERLYNGFKTLSKRIQDVFKTHSRRFHVYVVFQMFDEK